MRIQHPQPPREFNRKAGPPDVEGGPEHGDKAWASGRHLTCFEIRRRCSQIAGCLGGSLHGLCRVRVQLSMPTVLLLQLLLLLLHSRVITAANASLSAADGTENPRSLFPALPAKEALGPPPLDFVMMTSDEWGPQGGPPGPHERPPGQETLWELSDEPERSQPIKPLEEQAVGADTSATRPSSGAAAEESLQQVQGPAAPLLQPPQQSRKTEQRQNEQIVLLQQQEARQQINSATSSHSLYERENPGQQQQKQQEREEKEMQHETEPFGKDACAAASFHLHKQECYDPLKAALESAAAESLLPSLRRYLGLHAEPPPLMPFFLGGPRPPVPFLLPVATDTKGEQCCCFC